MKKAAMAFGYSKKSNGEAKYMSKRKSTIYPGVYQRTAEGRTFKGKADTGFDITYRHEGKKIWERIGWLSEGYSAKLAFEILAERKRSLRHGEDLPKEKPRAPVLQKAADKYFEWATVNRRNGAVDDINRYKCHLKPRFADIRIDEIEPFALERLKADMTKRGNAPQTIKLVLSLLRNIINRARQWGIYSGENPVSKIKLPKPQNERERALTHEEAKKLLDYLDTPGRRQVHDLVLLSLLTACRASEAFALRGCDVNFETDMVGFLDTKTKKPRHVPMVAAVREMLKRRMPVNGEDYVFPSHDGRMITSISRTFERAVGDLKINAGITDRRMKIQFHSLRHTALTWAAMGGASLRTLADIAGHRTLDMVRRYTHLTEGHIRETMNGFAAAFDRAAKGGCREAAVRDEG
jgi:integrase